MTPEVLKGFTSLILSAFSTLITVSCPASSCEMDRALHPLGVLSSLWKTGTEAFPGDVCWESCLVEAALRYLGFWTCLSFSLADALPGGLCPEHLSPLRLMNIFLPLVPTHRPFVVTSLGVRSLQDSLRKSMCHSQLHRPFRGLGGLNLLTLHQGPCDLFCLRDGQIGCRQY